MAKGNLGKGDPKTLEILEKLDKTLELLEELDQGSDMEMLHSPLH